MSVSGTAPVFWKAVGLSRPGTRVTMLFAGAEPVAAVDVLRIDVDAALVGGVEASLEVDPHAGWVPESETV